ncbi:MAG: hypothetical protein ACLUKN_00445 [Bacilli bacterium]
MESAEAEIENRKNLSSEIKREIASINAQSSSAKAAFSEKNSEIEKKPPQWRGDGKLPL